MTTESVIQIDDVHLSFPLVRMTAGGVKEAFLAFVLGRSKPKAEKVFWALKGVSLNIARGEVVGVIGKNGSGKSTLLRIIAGIYAPDLGTADTQGQVASLELGSGFREELTGSENIHLSGAIMGLSPKEVDERFDQIVSFADIGEFIEQPLRTYSSGMKVRLGFAVASVIEPDILLIDEVLAVGDREFREKSMKRIEEMVAGETTVIIVSHNMAELERLCSRLVLLDQGRIVSDGPVDEVIAQYTEKK